MALTFSTVHKERARGADTLSHFIVEITLDNSYPRDGYAIAVADIGMKVRIKHAHFHSQEVGANYVFAWDRTNGKMIIGAAYTSTGAGGGQLNNASAVLAGRKVVGHFYGT